MLAGQDIGFVESLMVSGAGILVVMLELSMLAVFIIILSKSVRFFESRAKKAIPVAAMADEHANADLVFSTKSQGELELVETDEPTAATIMAIVSNKTDIPLNRLRFIRIKKLEDKQA
jgi:Na+-transporting methylmalonyl-CoA/oxaloacetate decarboxylase gamma subunit